MRRFVRAALASFCLAGIANPASAAVLVLQPGAEGKDTWVYNSQDFDHGSEFQLQANASSIDQRILLEFAGVGAISPTATITSAALELYRFEGFSDTGITLDAHRILSSWVETATYSTQPTYGSSAESSALVTTNGWYSWDLTSLVQSWVNGSVTNNGVAIYDHGSSFYQRFYSSDANTDLRPRLTIEYENANNAVPEPASLALLACGGAGLIGGVFRKRRIPKS
jgi:hypothetical protein